MRKDIRIADKPTVDEILALLTGTESGLTVLKTILETVVSKNGDINTIITTIKSYLENSTYGLSALRTRENDVYNLLTNGTYGLSAIRNSLSSGGGVIPIPMQGL